MNAHRLRPVVVALSAVALAAVLTGCQGDDSAAGASGAPKAGATAGSATPGTAGGTSKGTGKGSGEGTGSGSGSGSGKGATAAATPAGKGTGPAKTATPAAGCVTKAPDPDHYDPDEFALYRVEELPGSTGKVNLVIQHGAWGCSGKDSDGKPFVVSGEDSRWAMDQAAYVTATNPITGSSTNQRIGVGELMDWVKAHPDSGLVFKYEVGADGSIDRLEQVYTP
ncbi:hypothetical protein [Streptomyces diastatochromogenes]|uniref:Lipoprotein n=1 Tax=Streptomyces diastatochromogenes TaxID=42236 RepID=A0A233SC15_STRDA|nr:hypothetical protein [Streptomyces diastatochromogenes]OXY93207.1 hypothetical protein BEK98_23590 [Streptomyces diastatochromogenes]